MITPQQYYNEMKYKTFAEKKKLVIDLYKKYNSGYNFEDVYYYSDSVGTKGKFLQGKLYKFDYFYSNGHKQRPYIDTVPLVFVIKEYIDKKDKFHKFKAINLNYLPDVGVIHTMQKFFEIYKEYLQRDINLLKDKMTASYTIGEKYISNFYKELLENTNIGYSVRVFKKQHVVPNTVRVISVEDYNKIYLYDGYENTIKGLTPKEVKGQWYK